MKIVDDARQTLTRRLLQEGASDGVLGVLISSDPGLGVDSSACRSNFFNALTLLALQRGSYPADDLEPLRVRFAEHLQSEVGPHGTVNYWTHDEPLRRARPYPNDLDTTGSALAALTVAYPSAGAALLGGAVRALTAVEVQEGGPYRTWLVTSDAPAAWRDIDVAVNANIAYFLSLHDIRLEPLDAWLTQRILRSEYGSPYYPSPFPIWYFLARGYEGPAHEKLRNDIRAACRADGHWGGVLESALAICALAQLSAPSDELSNARCRLAAVVKSSGIEASAFCIDSIVAGRTMYAGSLALTIAVCLEALSEEGHLDASVADKESLQDEGMFDEIMDVIQERAQSMGEPLTTRLMMLAKKMISGTPGREIPLLPFVFNNCLRSGQAPHQIVRDFGVANTLGWVAYTIYDDLIDGEGDVRDLPLANACLREVDTIFLRNADNHPSIAVLYHHVMDALERANAWEAQYARCEVRKGVVYLPRYLPSYGDLGMLADRSFGHALGPLCILLRAGQESTSGAVLHLTAFFRHALIARQLDDDAHDWFEDLSAGRINAVAERVLRAWNGTGQTARRLDATSIAELRRFFWEKCMDDIAGLILQHAERALASLDRIELLRQTQPLRKLVASARASAEKARRGVRETKTFIATYRGKNGTSDI